MPEPRIVDSYGALTSHEQAAKAVASATEQVDPAVAVTQDLAKGKLPSKSLAVKYLATPQQKRAALLFAKYDFSPLETLVAAATDPQADPDLKKSIAAMLLPYEVPKLKALDLTVTPQQGAPRVVIKNFTVNNNGQATSHGQSIDVTPENAASMPKPLADALSQAASAAIEQGLVEVTTGDDEDDD